MSACDDFIRKIEQKLPDQCTVKDLLILGLFTSDQSARHARVDGDTPSYFKLRNRIVYPKEAVIEWLKNRKYEGKYATCSPQTERAKAEQDLSIAAGLA